MTNRPIKEVRKNIGAYPSFKEIESAYKEFLEDEQINDESIEFEVDWRNGDDSTSLYILAERPMTDAELEFNKQREKRRKEFRRQQYLELQKEFGGTEI